MDKLYICIKQFVCNHGNIYYENQPYWITFELGEPNTFDIYYTKQWYELSNKYLENFKLEVIYKLDLLLNNG